MARLKQVSFEEICEQAKAFDYSLLQRTGLRLEHVPFKNPYIQMLWREHYVGSKGTIGRQFHYIVYQDGAAIGGISAGSAIFAHKKRDVYLNIGENEKKAGLRHIINNTMFRLKRPPDAEPLATVVLDAWKNRAAKDWYEKFGDVVRCFETLVEPPRWGGIYKLNGWKRIGNTLGLGARRPKGHGTFGKNSTGKRKIIKVPKKILWVEPIMSYEDALERSDSVASYGDEKKEIVHLVSQSEKKEFTVDELHALTGIERKRILICLNNISKIKGEVQIIREKYVFT